MFKSGLSQTLKFLRKPTVLLLVLAAAAIGTSFYLYQQNRSAVAQLKKLKAMTPAINPQEEDQKTMAQVNKLIELPAETPKIMTITNKDDYKDQPFLAKAENNDKLIIYTQAKKAILYRPSINKIVDVTFVNFTDQVAGASTSVTPIPTRRPSPTP
jgi:hypothetical protein